MVQSIIPAFPSFSRTPRSDGSPIIKVAECFSRTIQGEGLTVGHPCTFLRVQGCTLNCEWCDSTEVFRKGNPYTVKELCELFVQKGVVDDLQKGHHLVFTGGSPVRQQDAIVALIQELNKVYKVYFLSEIENECVLKPSEDLTKVIQVWNLSPKLKNSMMSRVLRYKPEVLDFIASLWDPRGMISLCWKFVVSGEEDWQEIEEDFIKPGYVQRRDIVLMPEGQTREELQSHYEYVVNLAVREGVRMTDRLQVTIWDKTVGV